MSARSTLLTAVIIAGAGFGVGVAVNHAVEPPRRRAVDSAEAPHAESRPIQLSSARTTRDQPVRVPGGQAVSRGPSLVGGVYTRDEISRSETGAIFVSKGAVSILERRALERIVGAGDEHNLADCLGAEPWPEQVQVELHVVSQPERIAIVDVRVTDPVFPPSVADCISSLASGLETPAERGVLFLRGDAWLRRRVGVGLSQLTPER